jgi:hypothetical protein
MGMNSYASPRDNNIREYIKALQRRDTELNRQQFADKGRDTLLDGYTDKDLEAVCRELWAQGYSSPECHFRTLVDVLLGHYMLTRGGDRRAAELSDLFTFEFDGEGPTRCMPLIFTTRASKQNQHGRLETIGALRHKEPLVCLLSALAFYLLYRWDLTEELFPDFSIRKAWYRIRLLKRGGTANREEQLSYSTQREWAAKAFKQADVFTSMITHAGRSTGAKAAELKGVSEDQIRRAGRWNQDQMVGCYLNALPREFMRRMAGHPSQPGCFEIRRASVQPPDVLLSLVWPELDVWKDRFGPKPEQINDLAATGLTSLLFYLREVILQDSIALRPRFPNSVIWMHPVFQHPAYELYARQAAPSYEDESPSQASMLYQAMPQLVDLLTAMDARAAQREARSQQHIAEFRSVMSDAAASQAAQASQLQQLLAGGFTFRLEAPAQAAVLPQLQLQPLQAASLDGSSRYTSARASAAASPAPQQRQEQEQEQPSGYRMSRAVKTVEQLWREWTVGLGGGLSVQALDSKWGSRWRAGRRSELQWYSLRLEAIKEIRRTAQAQRSSEEAAMWQLNLQQQRMGCSLDLLCKQLRAARKALIRK